VYLARKVISKKRKIVGILKYAMVITTIVIHATIAMCIIINM